MSGARSQFEGDEKPLYLVLLRLGYLETIRIFAHGFAGHLPTPTLHFPLQLMIYRYATFLLLTCISCFTVAGTTSLCSWEGAAQRYGVNAQVLYAIAAQESGLNPNAVHLNADGSQDVGLTQVNTKWLPHLSKFGVTTENLMDPCINMHVGAHILSLDMIRHGNTWQAIGTYHSNIPWRRDQYANTIYQRVQFQNKPQGAKGG